MRKLSKYYIELYGGYCSVITAYHLAQAKKIARDENGTYNLKLVRPATEKDLAWFQGMGGAVR